MVDLNELAACVEVLMAGSRAADADIHEALGNVVDRTCPAAWHSETETPAYTFSLDAAMKLVPMGRKWAMTAGAGARWQAWIWSASLEVPDWHEGTTPALALTAAALRARAAS